MKAKIVSFVLSETPRAKRGSAQEVKTAQSAPQYVETAVPKQSLIKEEKLEVSGKEVVFLVKSYKPDVLLVEASAEVDDIFSPAAFDLRSDLIDKCHEIIKKQGGKDEFTEEYSIAAVSDYSGDPEQFLKQYPQQIASFLKSEKVLLDENEIKYTLASQMKYTRNDLIIVDWDGAFIFYPEGDFGPIIDLFELANLQLLRYRMLDNDLVERLKKAYKLIQETPKAKRLQFSTKELKNAYQEVIKVRSQSMAAFEALEREIKLIGDWYSARLYELASKKFRLDEWRRSIREKLESLEDVYDIVSENFSVTRHQLLETIQMIGFFILQAGWFALIILEIIYFTR